MPVLNGSPKKLILNGKQYLGIMPSASLTTKNITANGTYNASSDNADGYSSVTVNVSGGDNISRNPILYDSYSFCNQLVLEGSIVE